MGSRLKEKIPDTGFVDFEEALSAVVRGVGAGICRNTDPRPRSDAMRSRQENSTATPFTGGEQRLAARQDAGGKCFRSRTFRSIQWIDVPMVAEWILDTAGAFSLRHFFNGLE